MSYQALYRKYRPSSLNEVVGQKPIIQTLKNAIEKDRIAHAYLFCGPRGTGKTSIAKIFAKMLNCEVSPLDPCGECANCKMVQNGSHPDIIEIDAASNNGVDEVRNLIDKVKYAPLEGKYKVYIIDEVHMMTTGAFNALLKTIEEPPSYVIFILATTEPHKVIPTIISRCQRFDFSSVSIPDIENRLMQVCSMENIKIDNSALHEIALLSQGGMRDALSILDQCYAYSPEEISLEDVHQIYGVVTLEYLGQCFQNITNKEPEELVKKLVHISDAGMDLKRFTSDYISVLKDSIILDHSPNSTLVSEDRKDILEKYFLQAPVQLRLDLLDQLMETFGKFTYASNILDYLETAFLKIFYHSYDRKKMDEANRNIIDHSNSLSKSNISYSHEFVEKENNTTKKDVNSPKNKEKNLKSPISDVSRETLGRINKSNDSDILEDEYVLRLLVGADKKERQSDVQRFKSVNSFANDLQFGRFAVLLPEANIFASGVNYIVVSIPSQIEAKSINSLQNEQGFEAFFEKILGKPKKIFAVDQEQHKRVISEFRKRMKDKNLPEPISFDLKKDEQHPVSVDDETMIKNLFPDVEVLND